MKYTLTIESDDLTEIDRAVQLLQSEIPFGEVVRRASATAPAIEQDAPEPPKEEKPTRRASKKQSRKSKDAEKPAAEAKAPSKDEVRKHLSAVGAEHGVEKVREICQRFGASGLRDLKEEHYAAAIAKCEEVMNGNKD